MDSNNRKFINKKSITTIRAFKPISQSVKVYEILLLPKKDLIRKKNKEWAAKELFGNNFSIRNSNAPAVNF